MTTFTSPMLAPNKSAHLIPGLANLTYPMLASPKLDGIRSCVWQGQLLSRSLKPIPNRYLQELFSQLPEGTDGELIDGNPVEDPYRRTVSSVMSEDGEPTNVGIHVFDNFLQPGGFVRRFEYVQKTYWKKGDNVGALPHVEIASVDDLEEYESKMLVLGFEGVMLRSLDGGYKQGRATANQNIIYKLKRYVDSEAIILGMYEEMQNDNEAFKNELGRTARSTCQQNLTGKDTLGGFEVRDVKTDVEFRIGTGVGLTKELRQELWNKRKKLPGQIVKYKYFPTGSKEKPRHPVFLGFRMKEDM